MGRDRHGRGCRGTRTTYGTERVLVATGRRPNTDNIAIDTAGVQVNERGEVVVDTYLRTNIPHIYVAGDVIGRQHNSQIDQLLAKIDLVTRRPAKSTDPL